MTGVRTPPRYHDGRGFPKGNGRPLAIFIPFQPGAIETSIPARFAAIAREFRHRPAIVTQASEITYEALDASSDAVAFAVLDITQGARANVALFFDNGPSVVTATLGVLKAGCAYVPLDTRQADGVNKGILTACQARLILTDETMYPSAATLAGGVTVVNVETLSGRAGSGTALPTVAPDDPAYIYFTGGTTGAPKGVIDTHRNLLHNVMRYTNTLYISPEDRLTLLQAPAYSGAVSSTFAAVLNGAATCPYDTMARGIDRLAAWLRDVRATIYHSVPSLFEAVAADGGSFPDVKVIRLEGDQAWPRHFELYRRHFPNDTVLVNGLGATECGLIRQFFMTSDTQLTTPAVPLGYEVEDMDVFVCDASRRPLPPGQTGEIAVKSSYLAQGYWERPDLTDVAFVPSSSVGERTYYTGDVGRMSGSGCLEWLGRKDMTRKVRGQNVDLTAVKSAVETLRGVREAAVVTREDRPGDVRLVAYFVPSGPDAPAFGAMRRLLREKLPDYMVPTAWMPVDAIPLTSNGKVDLRELPAPGMKRTEAKSASEPPRTPIEIEVAEIWAQVLSVQQVGRNDDFFELGGHSLSAAQVISRVSARFQVYISHEFLFRSATVAGMALAVAVQLVKKAWADGSDDLITRLLEDGLADSSPPVRQ